MRMEAEGRNWFDIIRRVAVLLLLSAFVTIAVLSKVIQYCSFRIDDWDTGIYSNVVWNLVSGDGFYSDVLNLNHLGEHFSPQRPRRAARCSILIVLGPATRSGSCT